MRCADSLILMLVPAIIIAFIHFAEKNTIEFVSKNASSKG
jgi:hypothetical protein